MKNIPNNQPMELESIHPYKIVHNGKNITKYGIKIEMIEETSVHLSFSDNHDFIIKGFMGVAKSLDIEDGSAKLIWIPKLRKKNADIYMSLCKSRVEIVLHVIFNGSLLSKHLNSIFRTRIFGGNYELSIIQIKPV